MNGFGEDKWDLLRSQKNQIFDLLSEYGLNPNDFDFTTITKDTFLGETLRPGCKHKTEDFYISFSHVRENNNGNYVWYCYFRPDSDSPREVWIKCLTWEDLYSKYITMWVKNLSKELHRPDSWEQLKNAKEKYIFETPLFDSGEKISYDEFLVLEKKLNEIKSKIKTVGIPDEDIKKINDKIDYLVNKAKNSSKIDWTNIFVGTVIQTIISLTLDDSKRNLIFQLFKSVLNSISQLQIGQ